MTYFIKIHPLGTMNACTKFSARSRYGELLLDK